MVKVYEIDAKNPEKFETIEEKTSINGTVNPLFGNKVRVKMMRCSGIDQAAVLIIDEDDFGRVWLRLSKYQGDYQYADESKHGVDTWKEYTKTWLECRVYYNNREQDIAMIVCGELHCAALTTEGDVFTCVIPESFTYEIGMENNLPTWTISRNWTALSFKGGDRQRALQTIVDDMDVQLRYKTDCNPMAASFGVTGGLRNPYLLNINTDEYAEQVEEYHENQIRQQAEENKKFIEERMKTLAEMKSKKALETKKIRNLEEQVEAHKTRGAHHKTTLEAAEKQVLEAKKIHDEAHAAHETHMTELNRLTKQLDIEHQKSMGIHSTSVDTHIPSTINHSSHTGNNTISASSKSKKNGFGLGNAVRNLLGKKPLTGENELHFEDIAHFIASREHRCTYI
jgi:hypothetical protein